MPPVRISVDVPPYGLSGMVYGAALNHHTALQALGDAVNQSPYGAPPRAPVLYIKPRNTLTSDGEPIPVPAEVSELEIGASLGLVIARPACRLIEESALDVLGGYV